MRQLSFSQILIDTLPALLNSAGIPMGRIALAGTSQGFSSFAFSAGNYTFQPLSAVTNTPFTGVVCLYAENQNDAILSKAQSYCQEQQVPLAVLHFACTQKEDFSLSKTLSNFSLRSEFSQTFALAPDLFAYQWPAIPQSLFVQYSHWLSSIIPPYSICNFSIHTPASLVKTTENEQTSVFLSVIMRTQGNRIEELREALLCLTAQSNTSFELLLMGHSVSAASKQTILEVVAEVPAFFRQRIFYHDVTGGNRSTPLNQGFALAKGDYISVLDDDDLVTANWVELFYKAAQKNSGKILHAYSLRQVWHKTPDKKMVSTQPAQPAYCSNFSYGLQLAENQCPFMSLAFPAATFRRSSLLFSEQLDVMEDWDFLMRFALVAGVADIPVASSVYRIWQREDTSRALHNHQQWEEQYHAILQQLDSLPLLLDTGTAGELATQNRKALARGEINPQNQNASLLYVDYGGGFSEDAVFLQANEVQEPAFLYRFSLPPSSTPAVAFRFDPAPNGEISVQNFSVAFYTSTGEKLSVAENTKAHNGVLLEDVYYFLLDDPQIIFAPSPSAKICYVEVSGTLTRPIPLAQRQKLFAFLLQQSNQSSLPQSPFAKLARRLKRRK